MAIRYIEQDRTFWLDTEHTSYIMAVVDEENFVGHVYYGQKLQYTEGTPAPVYLMRTGEAPFVPSQIVILIFLIVHFATKTSFVMGVMAVNTDGEHIEATGPDYFTDFLREHGVISKQDVVNLNYTIWIDPNSDSDVDSTNLSTIQVLFMTRSVDVFFSDEEFLKLMGGTDYLADLRDYLPKELLDRYEDQQIMVLNTMTGETIVAGIRLENNEWVRKTGWYQETAAVGLADGMKNPELAVALLEEILQ